MLETKLNDDIITKIANEISTKQTLVFMVGTPATGKSYISSLIAKQARNCTIVNMDNIMESLYGTAEVKSWAEISKLNKELGYSSNIVKNSAKYNAGKALEQGNSVIFDATNLRHDARVDMLKKIQNFCNKRVNTLAIIVESDIDTVKLRNKERERTVPWYVIRNMYRTAQLPLDDGSEFDKVIKIVNR